jgi:hypothetical protein
MQVVHNATLLNTKEEYSLPGSTVPRYTNLIGFHRKRVSLLLVVID